MKYASLFLTLFLYMGLSTYAQLQVSGIVVDAETSKPIPGTSVFVSNTNLGTITAADGSYILRVPGGKYEVIFSAVNYVTKVLPSDSRTDSFKMIYLLPKVKDLEEVIIRKYDPDGWKKWGQFFLSNFIGTNDLAEDCILRNPGTLRFYHNRRTGVVTVVAQDVLLIENNALGYTIKYQLVEFTYDPATRIVFFEGYPLFEEMSGNNRKLRRWLQNRKEAYYGSQLHFMRSVYRNTIAEEGFEVHRLQKRKNAEKERVKAIIHKGYSGDSTEYFNWVLSQPDSYDLLQASKLTGDSIAFAVDSVTAGMGFSDHLDITYTRKETPVKFRNVYPKAPTLMTSQITLLDIEFIQIQSDGSFYPTRSLLNLGYWGWSEKMSGMLPFGYKP